MPTLQNQVVLVVGASSGIGRETAALFAREGARVMASARRSERLRDLQSESSKRGHAIEFSPADAAKPEEMARLAEETRSRLGTIDILVYATRAHSAGCRDQQF
jgi:serine 3-dehydrogenase